MDTVEARVTASPSGETVYDAFISYAHDSDQLLAARLQAGVQRFAKPWWRRQAVRIFRDESSLSANPHLWGSITDAMDDSAWFVLLLSPAAAASAWVNREVAYWLEHKDPGRIIPVVSQGDFTWTDGSIGSDATPPALAGAFADEPRWVDLRSVGQLDLRNARFRDAVADVASALRGVPKDELESEEIRQHRRTIRTILAAAVVLLALAVAAVAAAFYAVDQRNDAAAFAEHLLDFTRQIESSDASPAGTVFEHADVRTIPLPVAESPPGTPRLDFLNEKCQPPVACFRTAVMEHPDEPVSAVAWLAGEPFHIRHGFVNTSEAPLLTDSPRPDYDVEVFVTRLDGPPTDDGSFAIGVPYRFTSDYLVREEAARCGPWYRTQTGPQPCDRFVHEFPNGLPAGLYDFWIEWRAPCEAWTTTRLCRTPEEVLTLFASSVRMMFASEGFHDSDVSWLYGVPWPFDPWTSEAPWRPF